MSREIKFRAWDKLTKEKHILQLCHHHSILTTLDIPSRGKWVNLTDFEEYTGLKDKNGKEIYEGDIMKIEDTFGVNIIYNKIVEYEDGGFSPFCIEGCETEPCSSETEIIGNMYENPELLEE